MALAILIWVMLTLAPLLAVALLSRTPSGEVQRRWAELADARLAALEARLGPADAAAHFPAVPYHLGGAAAIRSFRRRPGEDLRGTARAKGVLYVTTDLLGEPSCRPNSLGPFELVLGAGQDAEWAVYLLGRLGKLAREVVFEPGDVVDAGTILPKTLKVAGFLVVPFDTLRIAGRETQLLLCLGVTGEEMRRIKDHGPDAVLEPLQASGAYPHTDLNRGS